MPTHKSGLTYMEAFNDEERHHIDAVRYHLVPNTGTVETAMNITYGAVQLAFMDLLKSLDDQKATELQVESLEMSLAEGLRDLADFLENKQYRNYGNGQNQEPVKKKKPGSSSS